MFQDGMEMIDHGLLMGHPEFQREFHKIAQRIQQEANKQKVLIPFFLKKNLFSNCFKLCFPPVNYIFKLFHREKEKIRKAKMKETPREQIVSYILLLWMK